MQKPPTNKKKLSITDGQTNRQTDQLTVIGMHTRDLKINHGLIAF